MASAVDSRLAYARLSAVATASRLPTATRGSNNSYTTSWDTTPIPSISFSFGMKSLCLESRGRRAANTGVGKSNLTPLHDVPARPHLAGFRESRSLKVRDETHETIAGRPSLHGVLVRGLHFRSKSPANRRDQQSTAANRGLEYSPRNAIPADKHMLRRTQQVEDEERRKHVASRIMNLLHEHMKTRA